MLAAAGTSASAGATFTSVTVSVIAASVCSGVLWMCDQSSTQVTPLSMAPSALK